MNHQLAIFNYEGLTVRTIEKDGEPWFVAADVAEVLGYVDKADAIRQHCKNVNKITQQGDSRRPPTNILIIPERDVYRLIMRSKLPAAERFEEWVVGEVLPSIRKTGQYSMQPELQIAHAPSRHPRTTHGMSFSKIERVHHAMKQRCSNPAHQAYQRYGGRGIFVCEEWQAFEGFYKDMGASYKEGLTLDRRDNEKGYSKENCRWSTPTEQARNKRNNVKFDFQGQYVTLPEICEITGMSYGMMRQRLATYGLTLEEALNKPVRKSRRRLGELKKAA